ncbi:hypothetical protein NQ317_000166 [Molorchus minor]|uniref:Adenosine 3'-phospho 5'-phosphosulfate transporter 2 n=1 Tax=Molorchus minor TaxID=1323400 RepID=A0ABQ9J1V3_9CUCU|nr:hypothetical protein NQ317_000166 [Molorchus minor]
MNSKQGLLNPEPIKPKNNILCLDISIYSKTSQFLLCSAAVFVFFLLYGYLQELIFTIDGFQPFGWFLTLVQFGFYTIFGFIEIKVKNISTRKIPMQTYFLLAFLTLGTMGFSNASLGYLNYPTQVIFKCCKLIPVLARGNPDSGKTVRAIGFYCCCLNLIPKCSRILIQKG